MLLSIICIRDTYATIIASSHATSKQLETMQSQNTSSQCFRLKGSHTLKQDVHIFDAWHMASCFCLLYHIHTDVLSCLCPACPQLKSVFLSNGAALCAIPITPIYCTTSGVDVLHGAPSAFYHRHASALFVEHMDMG